MNESETLKRLFADVNRAAFAREHNVPGGQSMIYQHITGRKPISLDAAVAYAKGFRLPLSAISPRLADLVAKLPQGTALSVREDRRGNDTYSAKVAEFPSRTQQMLDELSNIAERLNERGLAQLIERAHTLVQQHPRARQNHSS